MVKDFLYLAVMLIGVMFVWSGMQNNNLLLIFSHSSCKLLIIKAEALVVVGQSMLVESPFRTSHAAWRPAE